VKMNKWPLIGVSREAQSIDAAGAFLSAHG
jgi:hypothetical protein